MAGKAIDKVADSTASSEEQADRKRRLVKGPEEFQKVRRDQDGGSHVGELTDNRYVQLKEIPPVGVPARHREYRAAPHDLDATSPWSVSHGREHALDGLVCKMQLDARRAALAMTPNLGNLHMLRSHSPIPMSIRASHEDDCHNARAQSIWLYGYVHSSLPLMRGGAGAHI